MTKTDIATLITALGGRTALQALLGVGPSAVSNYLAKGELPKRARPLICEALHRRGYQIDPQSMQIIQLPPTTPHNNTPHNTKQHHARSMAIASTGPTALAARGKSVLMIVGGGIAAYKALEVCRRLQDHNIRVTGVMTRSAEQFITPLSLSALTASKTYTDLFSLTDEAEMGHIQLARMADLVLVLPATANLMARAAHGLADDLATTILLATTAPVLMAPAMNPAMWSHPATRQNLETLRQRGVKMIGPDAGDTACGEQGDGRMSDPSEIVAACLDQLNADQDMPPQDLAGQRAIVTSGPTCEPIDSVRFIANRSSGRQGHAIAAALAKRGADVTLVSGPVSIADPAGVSVVHVETAAEMLDACEAAMPANIVVCAAAVADWRVKDPVSGKIKKNKERPESPHLELIENPDILKYLSNHTTRPSLVIGFAAETSDLQKHGQAKLDSKGCDWIVANPVDATDPANNVFGSEMNEALLLTKDGCEVWPPMPKHHLAEKLVDKISQTKGVENVED